jgi:hypothetical protein
MDDPRGPAPDGRVWCRAHSKQSGAPCKKLAVPGATVCRNHGAGAPQVRAAAARRVEEQRVRGEVAARIEEVAAAAASMHPIETMEMARAYSHAMAQVLAEVQSEADLAGGLDGQVTAAAEMFRRWTELAMKAGKTAADAGIDERRLSLSEAQWDQLAAIFDAVQASLLALVLAAVPEGTVAAVRGVWVAQAPRVIEAELRKVGEA